MDLSSEREERHELTFYYCSASYLKSEQMVIEGSEGVILNCAEWPRLGEGTGDGEKNLGVPTSLIDRQLL